MAVQAEWLLEEAMIIADGLLEKTVKEASGWRWDNLSWSEERGVEWQVSESIYSGSAGIVLLMAELYRLTGQGRYQEAVTQGLAWLDRYSSENPVNYYAFFTGRMGVAYTFAKAYETTGNAAYRDKALELALLCGVSLDTPDPIVDDLINGISGILLGLLHIHAITADNRLLPLIARFSNHLIGTAQSGLAGIYWDRDSKAIKGLCGFSHGASGIGYVFMELARYFNNPAFNLIAAQSFVYEDKCYDSDFRNWPDFRKGIFSVKDYDEHKEAYLNKDIAFFTKPGSMSAWCHGAPGIGLSRVRAVQLLADPLWSEDLERALANTEMVTVKAASAKMTCTLCHGLGGNAMLFLDAYKKLGRQDCLDKAIVVAEKIKAFRQENGFYYPGYSAVKDTEDVSLFMGNAGIAYFFLQCYSPDDTPTIIAPELHAQYNGDKQAAAVLLNMGLPELRKKLLSKNFARTIELLEQMQPAAIKAFFEKDLDNKANLKKEFRSFVNALNATDEKLLDIFGLENEKSEMDENIASEALLNIEQDIIVRHAGEMIRENRLDEKTLLKLKQDLKLKTLRWYWNSNDEGTADAADEHTVLLSPMAGGVSETKLSDFSAIIIHNFIQPQTIAGATKEVLDGFEIESEEEALTIKDLVLQQVKEALASGVLVPV